MKYFKHLTKKDLYNKVLAEYAAENNIDYDAYLEALVISVAETTEKLNNRTNSFYNFTE